jgi:hypothetical protein
LLSAANKENVPATHHKVAMAKRKCFMLLVLKIYVRQMYSFILEGT